MEGWKILTCFGDSSKRLARMRSVDNGAYEVTVSDLQNCWKEILTTDDIEKRCKELNRRLEAPSKKIVQHIQQALSKHDSDTFSIIPDPTGSEMLTVKMRNSFQGGIPFNWEFCLERLYGNDLTHAFLSPMLKIISSLQCANEQLIKIIAKKDSEIRDYKDSGGKVTRPYLETVEFQQEDFDQELRASTDYNAAIGKDIFIIASGAETTARLLAVESDLIQPRMPASSTGILAPSQSKSPVAKIAARARNRRILNKRRPPKGVNVSDSNSDTEDEVVPKPTVKRSIEEKKVTKKKIVDKRKKLF